MTAPMTGTSTHFRTCPLCEATCGLEVEVVDGAVRRIRGDMEDVFSKGYLCPKGSTLKQLHEDPDRLRQPLVRKDGVLSPATGDEAYAAVAEGLGRVQAEHGRDAVALYLALPLVMPLLDVLAIMVLMLMLPTMVLKVMTLLLSATMVLLAPTLNTTQRIQKHS